MKRSRDEVKRHWEEGHRVEREAKTLAASAKHAKEDGFREGFEEGFEQGFETGFRIGLEKGTIIGRISLWQEFLGQPETPRDQLAHLSEADLTQVEEALKAELIARKSGKGWRPAVKG